MATKGTFAAYKPLTGVGEQTTRNIQQAEYMGFRYRREEQMKKDRKRDRLSKLATQMGTDMSELQFNDSGIKSVDAPLYEYFSKTKGEVADLYQRIEQDPDDYEARILLEKKMNSAKTLAGFTERYATWQQDYSQGLAEGKYSQYLNRNLPERINQGLKNGNYKILNDKNGDLQLIADIDGDGELDEDIAAINVQEFLSGNPLYAPKAATGRFEAMDAIAERFGTVEIKEDAGGFKKREYSGFDPEKTDDLHYEVNRLLGQNKEQMSDAAKSIIADDLGLGDPAQMSNEQFQEFKEEFAQGIINKFDRTESETTDFGARNSANSLAYRKQRDATEDAREDTKNAQEEPQNTIEVMTGETGSSNASGTTLFSLPEAATLDTGGGIVKTFQVQMQGDDLKFRGNITKGTGQDKTTSAQTITRDDQKNVIVRQIPNPETGKNFTNLSEFKQYLDKLKQGQANTEAGYGDAEELPDYNP